MPRIKVKTSAVIDLVAGKMYSKPTVFLRENVQNAVDALRMSPDSHPANVLIHAAADSVVVEDCGIGMSEADLQDYYWTIGRTSKNTNEARRRGVIGRFGIGAFANFGVCAEVTVESWRRNCPKVYSTVSKQQLKAGNPDYEIGSQTTLDHYGTRISVRPQTPFEPDKLRSYLRRFVRYVPEKIQFNGDTLSGDSLDIAVAPNSQILGKDTMPFAGHPVLIQWYSTDGKISVQVTCASEVAKLNGLLTPVEGPLDIFTNSFLICSYSQGLWARRVQFSGILDTNLVQPNATREDLDQESEGHLEDFLARLSEKTLATLQDRKDLFEQPAIRKYVSRHYWEAKKYLDNLEVRLYKGRPTPIGKLIERKQQAGVKVLLASSENIPLHIESVSRQGTVSVVMLGDLEPELRQAASRRLIEKAEASEISEFSLEATPVEEPSSELVAIQRELERALRDIWGIENPSVNLREVARDECHLWLDEGSNDQVEVFLNVNSPVCKTLQDHLHIRQFTGLLNSVLIAPNIGDSLLRLIPKEVGSALLRFEAKPEAVLFKEVTTLHLVRGGDWKGPTTDCIKVKSEEFRHLEGFYIRLPDRLGLPLRPVIASSQSPLFMWFADTVVVLFETESGAFLLIQLRLEDDVIVYNKQIHGTKKQSRLAMLYETGVFLPIPDPHLADLLPTERPVRIEFSYRSIGLADDPAVLSDRERSTKSGGPQAKPWSQKDNERRCDLIDKDTAGTITDAEKPELVRLQERFHLHLDKEFPPPTDGAQQLHQELLERRQHR